MSKRIKDSLDVLRLIRDLYHKDNSKQIAYLRSKAINIVAERGVDSKTVYAHLVGKNVSSKLPANRYDDLLKSWLENNSTELKDWYLLGADRHDKVLIEAFFGKPQILDTPKASDINDPPETTRIETTTYRILRDTALSREVKIAQQFKCQLCAKTLQLGDGSFYAEAHHVKPLGRPYNGPDTKDNIICVCPTCHVLLDYKVIRLDQSQVPNVASTYINFHNDEIYGKNKTH
ncbi:MAG: HNH endonuclease [Deltaproteobacteria bacterium]|nr:HNH endonuclease [Deltaproteobacteria bacterium]